MHKYPQNQKKTSAYRPKKRKKNVESKMHKLAKKQQKMSKLTCTNRREKAYRLKTRGIKENMYHSKKKEDLSTDLRQNFEIKL